MTGKNAVSLRTTKKQNMKKYDYNNDASADSATENTANEPWAYGTAAMEDHPAASRHPSKGGEWCEVETPDNDLSWLTPELMASIDKEVEDYENGIGLDEMGSWDDLMKKMRQKSAERYMQRELLKKVAYETV
jgi:hypothetical protein